MCMFVTCLSTLAACMFVELLLTLISWLQLQKRGVPSGLKVTTLAVHQGVLMLATKCC